MKISKKIISAVLFISLLAMMAANTAALTGEWGAVGDLGVTADINGDGQVGEEDLSILLDYIKGIEALTPAQFKRADISKDNIVDIRDYNIIYKKIIQSSKAN